MQILISDTEIELKTDIGIDSMQCFLKLETNKVAAFKPLLKSFFSLICQIHMDMEVVS